jgi:Flp pilus assembly pilin Flp
MTKSLNRIGVNLALMFGTLSLPSLEREEGQTLAEYALILFLIALAVIGAVILLGGKISSIFSSISSQI